MTGNTQFKYYPLTGAAFDLLRAYNAEIETLKSNHEALLKEYQDRANAQADKHKARLRDIWSRMSAAVGLDPAETWGNGQYSVETRYLADGFGALTFVPMDPNPLAALFGSPDSEPEQAASPSEDLPPKGTVLN
jgi:hypothetical protein